MYNIQCTCTCTCIKCTFKKWGLHASSLQKALPVSLYQYMYVHVHMKKQNIQTYKKDSICTCTCNKMHSALPEILD